MMTTASTATRAAPLELTRALHELAHPERFPVREQRRRAQRAIAVHAVNAGRLGMHPLRCALEDRAFSVLEPEQFRRLQACLDRRNDERERNLARMIAEAEAALRGAGVAARVTGRAKHLYGVWRKMRRKGLPFAQVHDVRALRVLVGQVPDCYAAADALHRLWRPLPEEFDDYIAHPKPGGYRSLHTALVRPDGRTVEVQIRTLAMHRACEAGENAHWRYKERTRNSDPAPAHVGCDG